MMITITIPFVMTMGINANDADNNINDNNGDNNDINNGLDGNQKDNK